MVGPLGVNITITITTALFIRKMLIWEVGRAISLVLFSVIMEKVRSYPDREFFSICYCEYIFQAACCLHIYGFIRPFSILCMFHMYVKTQTCKQECASVGKVLVEKF